MSDTPTNGAAPVGPPTSSERFAGRAPQAWRRGGLALAVATMGLVDLLSALLSHPPDRLVALRHLIPTDVLDTSRTFTLLAGALLLVTAWGLRRGKRRAFVAALFLCAISVPVNLLKAFDFEEATVAAALMFALGVSAEAFRVESRALSLSTLRSRAVWAVLALGVYAIGGTWVVKLLFGHRPSWRLAFADAGWRLFGIGSPVEMVPRSLPPGSSGPGRRWLAPISSLARRPHARAHLLPGDRNRLGTALYGVEGYTGQVVYHLVE